MSEDLGIKVVEKEKVFWENLKEKVESDNSNMKNSIEINDHIKKLIETKLK